MELDVIKKMPIKMETVIGDLSDIKSEIKVEDYCEPSVSVTATTLVGQPQQHPHHHPHEIESHMHHPQNNCWVRKAYFFPTL